MRSPLPSPPKPSFPPLPKPSSPTHQVLVALLGGLVMGLAPAPESLWLGAWLALVPLWYLILGARSPRAAGLGFAWGLGYHGLALVWITGVHPLTWMGVPWLASLAIALVCWLAITLWGAILTATWAGLLAGIGQRCWQQQPPSWALTGRRLLVGTALWCGCEALWSAGPLWWTALAYTQSPQNLWILHLGQVSGPTAIAAVLVGVNGALAEALGAWRQARPRAKGYLGLAIALFLSAHALGAVLYAQPRAAGEPLRVGIVQGNIPNTIKLSPEGWRRAIAGYTSGYQQLVAQGVDIVLTPETALPFYWERQRAQSSLYQAIRESGIPAWVGAYGDQGHRYTNSLFTVTGDGATYSRYDKVKLVPLGEYIPFEPLLGRLISRLSPLEAQLAAGAPTQVFDTPWGRAIVGICYESAFPRHFRRQTAAGGEFILTASNNAHYSASMPAQHHAQDVLRAIESDRWAVRATNTGYSAFVSPRGETLWIGPLDEYALQAGTIERRHSRTLYVRWGDWLLWLLLVLGGLSLRDWGLGIRG